MANAESPKSSADSAGTAASLPEKVAWLFDNVRVDGRLLTDTEAADAMAEAGETISRQAIYNLRTGRTTKPAWPTIDAIAKVFDVPVAYFSDGEEGRRIAEQLDLVAALRNTGLSRVALREFTELSPAGLQAVAEMIQSVLHREKDQAGNAGSATETGHTPDS